MAGHSKWAQIKRKKEKMDKRRGQIFTKLIREITVAAREGGGNPDFNPRLRLAIEHAKANNMPWENIERAIKKGTGELPGVNYEEVRYEGYGPGGVAFIIESMTDNKNRTTAEIRHIFSKHGGHLGSTGCVAWMFKEKGFITVEKSKVDEDTIIEIALEGGAEDVKVEDDYYEIVTDPKSFHQVKTALEEKGIVYESCELTKIPQNTVKLEGDKAIKILKLMEELEEHPDVQHVYANFDIPENLMMEVSRS